MYKRQIFQHGCNLQSLGEHRVMSLKRNEAVNEKLAAKGMEVIELNITEILKAGGGPHCMTSVSYTHLDVYKRQI